MSWKLFIVVSVQVLEFWMFVEPKTYHLLFVIACAKCILSIGDPFPPSLYLDINIIKWTRLSPCVFAN